MSTEITINGLSTNGIAYCEATGLSLCFAAYAAIGMEEIMEGGIGFNDKSGYTYIALENGVSICSMLGREVEYMVSNPDDGEEAFFENYEDAENHTWPDACEEDEEEA